VTLKTDTSPHYRYTLRIHNPPNTKAPIAWRTLNIIPDLALIAAFSPPGLVPPICPLLSSERPFEEGIAEGSYVAVLCACVHADVLNVCVACPSFSASSVLSKNTSAKPGAGTGITQVFLAVSQLIVFTSREPLNRPSTSNWFPSVWPAHVMFSFVDTDDAFKYLFL